MSTAIIEPQPYRFSVEQFNGLAEAGVIPMDTSVELGDGVIFERQPLGSHHCSVSQQIGDLLAASSDKDILIRVGKPIILDDFSEPVPDIVVARKRTDDPYFSESHPSAPEISLVIEVSDSSYLKDRNVKPGSYARASIPEVWIVNLANSEIQWFTEPDGENEVYLREGHFESTATPERKGFSIDLSKISF